MPRKPLTARQLEVLRDLYVLRDMETTSAGVGWLRPMDCSGSDASHHSSTLASLVRLGLAERKRRAGITRPSWTYRISPEGEAAIIASRRPGGAAGGER